MLQQDAVAELTQKLKDYGCNVADVDSDKITSESIDFWAHLTHVHNADFASDGEEPVFSNAELFAIVLLSKHIAKALNANVLPDPPAEINIAL